ncbi:aldo/keto reductase [Bhargavaea ullalensis]|uniref:Aryl-alcohol dehydrogenase-like predicted oxidoreductase n=1 Tax=Bhargavaea ullalensis TaxID=1265685 RepID=A0ABV2GDT1_9BACL
MEKRKLGNDGPYVSEIAFGCMSLPDDLDASSRIIDAALDAGINYFDTADLYMRGRNEELTGRALGSRRKDVILATKVGNRWTEGRDGWTWDASPEYIRSAVRDSLRRLQTDYIDLYQLHGGTNEDDLDAVIDVFEELKKEGLIRQYGISSIRPNAFRPFLEKSEAVSVMMQYSLLDRRPEEWLAGIQNNGASVVARGPLAKGLLTAEAGKRSAQSEGFESYSGSELREIADEFSRLPGSLHGAALGFVLGRPEVAAAVAGASSAGQLEETLKAYRDMPDKETIEAYAALTKTARYENHRE